MIPDVNDGGITSKTMLDYKNKHIKMALTLSILFCLVASPICLMYIVGISHLWMPAHISAILIFLSIGAAFVGSVAVVIIAWSCIPRWQIENLPITKKSIVTGVLSGVTIGLPFVIIMALLRGPTVFEFCLLVFYGGVACILIGIVYALCLVIPYKAIYWLFERS